MRIGIEAQRIFRLRKFGMDIVAIELIRQLQQLDTENEYVIFVNPDEDVCIGETHNFKIHYIRSGFYPAWEQYLLPKAVKQARVDLLHCTSNTAPLRLTVPLILTLHDVINLEPGAKYRMSFYQATGRLYRRWLIPRIIPQCRRLITVSDVEKQLICKKFPAAKNKISAIHNGVDQRFQPVDKAGQMLLREKYRLPEQYIAFIGNTDPRKNLHNVLLAYSVYLKHSGNKTPLVILHFNEAQLKSLLRKLRISPVFSHIRLLDYLAAADMPGFYAASEMFLFPSLREGFGMPVLEAMACGTPVITSNISSMPEIAGEAALLANPFDVDDIALNMLYLEQHPEVVQTLCREGLARIREFSWKAMAQQVFNIYRETVLSTDGHRVVGRNNAAGLNG